MVLVAFAYFFVALLQKQQKTFRGYFNLCRLYLSNPHSRWTSFPTWLVNIFVTPALKLVGRYVRKELLLPKNLLNTINEILLFTYGKPILNSSSRGAKKKLLLPSNPLMLISSKKNIFIFLVFSFYSFAQTTVRYIAESRLFSNTLFPFFLS